MRSSCQLLGLTSLGSAASTDASGHGSHVTGIMLNTERTADGRFFGVAPDANLVSVRAFDADGRGTYSSVIRGIDWIVRNKSAYRIRVLNLSLGAAPQSRYWDDPLNRAVMKAWQSGIVVVASAGNTGPGGADHHRAGQRAVRDHGRRDDGQLHARESGRRSARVFLRRGPDVRRLREA